MMSTGLARAAVFDKTGTLTYGGADLIEVETATGQDPDKALRLLASLEHASHHILAENIVAVARKKGLALSNPSGVPGASRLRCDGRYRRYVGKRRVALARSGREAFAAVGRAG